MTFLRVNSINLGELCHEGRFSVYFCKSQKKARRLNRFLIQVLKGVQSNLIFSNSTQANVTSLVSEHLTKFCQKFFEIVCKIFKKEDNIQKTIKKQ